MKKKAAPLFGAAWVRSLYESRKAVPGLAPGAIAKLTFTGGAPLPPSLAAALEHDRSLVKIDGKHVRATKFAVWAEETLPVWAEALKKGLARTFPAPCVALDSGSDSGRFLYLGAANDEGEYPVVTIDVDDVPEWWISYGGFDAWLASDLGAERKGTDARIADHAKRCFKGKKRGKLKVATEDAFKHDMIVFGRVKTALDAKALRRIELKDAPTNPGFEYFFPSGRDATLDSLLARLGPKEFVDVTVRKGEAIVQGDIVDADLKNITQGRQGKLTAVRNWFFAVAKQGAEWHFVARENGRPINAWRVKVSAQRVAVKRLDFDEVDEVTEREEYLSITKR